MNAHLDRLLSPRFPSGNMNDWQGRHMAALTAPSSKSRPIVNLLMGWLSYADAHKHRYESGIGEDGFLGPAWVEIGRSIRQLLNGDCGELDCGTLDSAICASLIDEGVPESEL